MRATPVPTNWITSHLFQFARSHLFQFVSFVRQLIRVSPSTDTAILLTELGHLSLEQRWLQACIRFWNALVALPVDDLFGDVMYDSLQEAGTPGPRNAGFAKGVRDQCALLGFSLLPDRRGLLPDRRGLLPICLETVLQLSRLQLQSEAAKVDVCPRTCPTKGAACCKYTRWFRRTPLQCERPVHELRSLPILAKFFSCCASA